MFKSESIQSYWLEDKKTEDFNTLNENIKSEITIIGGGITGITLAYLLSQANINVTVVDAGKVFSSTTGHTTAKITAQHSLIYNELIDSQGIEKAGMYYKANKDAINFIKSTIAKEDIKANLTVEDAYVFTNNRDYITKIKQEFKAYEKLGIKGELLNDTPLELQAKSAIRMNHQAQFHPVKYLNSLMNICLQSGVNFYENTTVVDINKNENNIPIVQTYDGKKIESDFVVVASHYPVKNLKKLYFAKLQQNRSYVIASEINDEYPGGMYINIEQPTRSIRHLSTKDGKNILFVTGENHKTGTNDNIKRNKFETLFDYTKSIYEINRNDILAYWATQDIMTIDKIPYIGQISNEESKILIATGYNKWGMTQSAVAAHELFEYITTGKSKYQELYSPSRKHTTKSIKGIFKNSMEASKEMVLGKLGVEESLREESDKIDYLEKDEAMTTYFNGNRIGIYRDLNSKLHIVDTTCTHMRCETNWNSEERTWDCPCHGSRFCYTADVIEGPATKPLLKIKEEEIN